MLLIISNKSDLASDFLLLRAEERGISTFRLNTEDFGKAFEIELFFGEHPSFIIEGRGRTLSHAAVRAVYLRQPRVPEVAPDIAAMDTPFVRQESNEVLRSLWRIIDRDMWLNHPNALWLASNKIDQLCVAKRLGFEVPQTLVTSSVESIRRFHASQPDGVVCKAIKHSFLNRADAVLLATTKRLTDDDIVRLDEYAKVPAIYQNEIPKKFDVRVTVVGDRLVATAIHSQDQAETEVDWRAWDVASYDLQHEIVSLPVKIAESCFAITRHYGLRYAAIDLVLDRKGDYHFLELNPNGQWAWIEQKTGYPVRDAILDTLGYDHA